MDLGLAGLSVLLVGASRGIGLATARAFAAEGCRVAIVARHAGDLEAAAGALLSDGHEVLTIAADACREEDAERAFQEAIAAFSRVDILVNFVGGSRGDPGIEAPEGDWDEALAVNLRAAVRMTRLVVPDMRRRGRGAIVNVSSIFGREWGGAASYNAAKAALIAYTKSCSWDLAPHGVRVNSIAPGSILFPGGSWDRRRQRNPAAIEAFAERELPLGRFGRPEEVAATIVFIASPVASLVIGSCLNVDGGQSRSLL